MVMFVKIKIKMSEELSECPSCQSPYGYATDENQYICPKCSFEWAREQIAITSDENVVLDTNGAVLHNGDSVIVIKDLPVKGAPKNIKAGTKVKNIRLTVGDHNIDCKIDGFGAMALKSEFVKKA
jgi:protein PhnA